MSVPAPPVQQRRGKAPQKSPAAAPVAVLVVSAVVAGVAIVLAPDGARSWTLGVAAVAWVALAAAITVSGRAVRRARGEAAARDVEVEQLRAAAGQSASEAAYLVNVVLPALTERLREGMGAAEALGSVAPPRDPQLRRVQDLFAATAEESARRAAGLDAERRQARRELELVAAELERLTRETLPTAVARLREGRSADTVRGEVVLPELPVLRAPAEVFLKELAHSERRAAAAQAASAKALSRVQAKSVSMLADLREMQERHGEEVFGDLLKLDHATSQLGLMTDRLALLMGGRSSRAWNKPIVMESILRGAVGRIAAYQRVRLHCSTTVAISGYAAEGVMHLLAELMDNAANFSPPIDEVHVYVEERSAGIVVTIEDSGLKMADAAMRRAAEAVSGRMNDLVSLQGTRLGLAVVGRLAAKHGISVNYRPSSRGGTGVVVLLPRQLLAQQQHREPRRAAGAGRTAAGSAPAPIPAAGERDAVRSVDFGQPADAYRPGAVPAPAAAADDTAAPPRRDSAGSTPNGLPVRRPGRTMGEAERGRARPAPEAREEAPERRPGRDAGSRFGAFHRGRRAADGSPDASGPAARPDFPDAFDTF
ncbi:ATP-binding protein [Streptomyces sp. ODS05-4]|uniref:sensor histidine kinase n=1 Tax=Streptomyces sp. ODS05-4 TaxID=2944939 RepID=UPI00210A1789|nr:ATP-binding protein [Streptomyces sp. ODS05-4]